MSDDGQLGLRVRAQALRDELREIQLEANEKTAIARARLHSLQERCTHPAKYQTSTMGDLGWFCPDCFWSR